MYSSLWAAKRLLSGAVRLYSDVCQLYGQSAGPLIKDSYSEFQLPLAEILTHFWNPLAIQFIKDKGLNSMPRQNQGPKSTELAKVLPLYNTM
jgi:hypothetical protein